GSCTDLLLFAEFVSSSLVRQAQGGCFFQSHIHSRNCRMLSISTLEFPQTFGQQNGFIAEGHEGPHSYNDQPPLPHPPDCCRSDARSDRAHTSPTSDARRATARRSHDAARFRAEGRRVLARQW